MIDTHVHIWDPAGGPHHIEYPWLTPELGPLFRAFDLAEIEPTMDSVGIAAIVLVQASDSINESEALLAAAAASARSVAVVGWLPLAHPDELKRHLAGLANQPSFVGVRHLIHDDPDKSFMLRPAVGDGFELLASAGLTFDAVAETLDLLAQVDVVAQRHQGLTIVIDHLGKPPIAGPTWNQWADLLAAAASNTNVVAKISGLGTISPDHGCPDDWAPSVQHALRVFGPDRLMIGSDWPVSTLHISYESTISALLTCLDTLTSAALSQVLTQTAQRVYRLVAPQNASGS